ncbi:MAG: GGDEF domain-containing protein [Pseudomonadales bacterium]|nr:GGDEF domain-containing protein [Pseudomonadales bacterium]
MSNINQDVQASHKILTLLETANAQTEQIIDLLPGIFLIFNDKFDILRGNNEATQVLSAHKETLLRKSVSDLFRTDIWEVFQQNLKLLDIAGNESSKFELPIKSFDRKAKEKPYYWRLSRLKDHNEVEGNLYTLLGEDISQLRESESKLMNVFSSIPLGIMTIDEHGDIEDTYSSYLQYLFNVNTISGCSLREIVFDPIQKDLTGEDIKGIDNIYVSLNREEQFFESLKDSFPNQIFLYKGNNKEEGKHLGFSYKPVTYDGIVKRILIIVEDRTAIVQAEEDQARANMIEKQSRAIYESAIRDPLTGLYTRFYMEDQAEALINNHNRHSISELSLIIFDIDHFKPINDTHGHDVGDIVLRQVAGVLLRQVRKTDIPVRFGGEEFLIFLPGNHQAAQSLAERVRKEVEETDFEAEDKVIPVTISGGVAEHVEGELLADLIKKADRLLYQAKKGGRNQIVSAE